MAELATDKENLRNALVEAVNARDRAMIDDLFDPNVADELDELLQWRPRLMLTRGELRGEPVAVAWTPDLGERYVQAGHVVLEVDAEDDSLRLVNLVPVEGIDPDLTAESPPGLQVAEWETEQRRRGDPGWI